MKGVCKFAGTLTTGFQMQNGRMLEEEKSFIQRHMK
jgi:hypothetical protein